MSLKVKIRPANFPADLEIVSQLFLAYAQSLPIKLDFQGFEHELAGLPGKYAVESGGAVFLASIHTAPSNGSISKSNCTSSESSPCLMSTPSENVIGCIALRSFPTSNGIKTCELKRLYLAPESRGKGVAKLLMDVVLAQARQLEYQEMLLDTLDSMTTARRLYERYGFEEIQAYYESCEGAVFYKLKLGNVDE